ncbi:snRNA-activating protein complex subunit 2 [Austrofundulus limnaeus]|uniref:snRNA-activating protein complex subunit 2 n=1 Tax=Austrofundulus limnaeus TaxID=52670 RepID=A0A2I4CB07_AUSLI|nr:PREDICTED: snRNA-activating protein complex subunit 2 [Austrofundulus limnaeus]
MKPPPRARVKRTPFEVTQVKKRSRRQCTLNWTRSELKKLLDGLKKMSPTGQHREINHGFLKKKLPMKSMSEISSKVDCLKNKLISAVSFQLQKLRWEEKRNSKPIDEWTHMASAVAGTLEAVISAAFSRMLIVSSTEPCTLRNCDPFPVPRPLTKPNPTVWTIPLRRMLPVPVEGKVPGTVPCPVSLKTPSPTMDPARRFSAPYQVVRVPNSPQTPSVGLRLATAQVRPGGSSPVAAVAVKEGRSETFFLPPSPQTSLSPRPIPTTPPQSFSILSRCSSTPPTVPSLATIPALHTGFEQSSKHKTEDRTIKDQCVVDFEKIYNFLSAFQNHSEDFHLTPMESAIVLDLLMSLPEELCLLDCQNLHKHMIQVYRSISAPADSQMAKKPLIKVEYELRSQSDPAGTSGGTHSSDCGEKRGTLNEPGGPNMLECYPPLNPFMVPLKLLQRKQTSLP